MIISDLNYLENLDNGLEDIAGGSFVFFDKFVNVNVNANYNVGAFVDPFVRDNTALSNGRASAFGNNTFTETYNETLTDGFSSNSYGEATSITD